MKNPRITAKEWGLIKGALRRVFSRSDLRKQAIDASRIDHVDPERPRVKKWSRCPECSTATPTYLMECDHTVPVVPIDKAFHDMTADELVNNLWCDPCNLQAICVQCHKGRSKTQNAARRAYKKGKSK